MSSLRRLRSKLSYANVMSTFAVFLGLAGGSIAIASVSKNSVESKHVINDSLRGVDFEDGALKNHDVKPNGLTGSAIDESTLEGVTIDGARVITFLVEAGDTGFGVANAADLFDFEGLNVRLNCTPPGTPGDDYTSFVGASSEFDNADLYSDVVNPGGRGFLENTNNLDSDSDFEVLNGANDAQHDNSIAKLTYRNGNGRVVTATITTQETPTGCVAYGTATGGPVNLGSD